MCSLIHFDYVFCGWGWVVQAINIIWCYLPDRITLYRHQISNRTVSRIWMSFCVVCSICRFVILSEENNEKLRYLWKASTKSIKINDIIVRKYLKDICCYRRQNPYIHTRYEIYMVAWTQWLLLLTLRYARKSASIASFRMVGLIKILLKVTYTLFRLYFRFLVIRTMFCN